MGHGHSHGHHHHMQGKKLFATVILNMFITAAEVIGGILSGSLSLLSDALHNFSDGIAVFLAWMANRISQRDTNERKTFGYKRIEILAAFINAITMVAISFYLMYEAVHRLFNPKEIDGLLMLIVASAGLLANLAAVLILQKDSKSNINIKAAYLHLIGDTLSSVAVIIGGIFIYYFQIYWLDPVITFLVAIYILKETWHILKESFNILMQASPAKLDLPKLKQSVENIPEVINIHHLHAWNLNDHDVHFECHVEVNKDYKLSELNDIQTRIEHLLEEEFHIHHVTLQFGLDCCSDKSMVSKNV